MQLQGCKGQLQKVYAHLAVTIRNHWRWQQRGWWQVPTIGLFCLARTISWPAPAVSTVDEESSWAGQSALVDSPQQSVGDMSGKTFLLLLSVILCTRAWFWSFQNSVVPVSRKWDDILNHMCRNNCELWRSVRAWWRQRDASITSAKKWAGKESVSRYSSYEAPSMRNWRFAGNFVQNCYGTRATGYEEDLHMTLLCHICLRISVSSGG